MVKRKNRIKKVRSYRLTKEIPRIFKNPAFWLITFILLASATYFILKSGEQNNRYVPLPALDFGGDESICGNGLIEIGESCSTCFIDSPCASNEVCSAGICEKKKFNLLILTIPAIILALLAIALLGYQGYDFMMHAKDEENRRLSGLIDYISKSLKSGQKDTEVMISVVRAGWDKNDAVKALAEAKKSLLAR